MPAPLAFSALTAYNCLMSVPRRPTEAELLAIMDASDADYEAGRFVSGEEVAARIQAALDRYAVKQGGDSSSRAANRR